MSFYEYIKTIHTICKFLFFRDTFDLVMGFNKRESKDVVSSVYLCCYLYLDYANIKTEISTLEYAEVIWTWSEQSNPSWPHCEWQSLTRLPPEIFFNLKYSKTLKFFYILQS